MGLLAAMQGWGHNVVIIVISEVDSLSPDGYHYSQNGNANICKTGQKMELAVCAMHTAIRHD